MRAREVIIALGIFTCAGLRADILLIGNTGGEVFGRNEYDLGAHLPQYYLNYGAGVSINALAANAQGGVAIGDNYPFNMDTRNIQDLAAPVSSIGTGNATTAVAAGPAGQVAFGDSGNLVFMREITDLTAYPPGYTSTDGLNFNASITAIAFLPDGNIVVGNAAGEIFVRSGTDISVVPVGVTAGYVNFAIPITALAIDAAGDVVIGLQDGLVQVRPWEDVTAVLSSVNFGVEVTALATMTDGTVAIGLDNGQVSLRSTVDLVPNLQTLTFTGGEGISAIAVSSNGNLGIGTESNLVFVRQGSDLLLVPEGFQGVDGLNFNAPISALAFAIPEPSLLLLLGPGLIGVLWWRRKVEFRALA